MSKRSSSARLRPINEMNLTSMMDLTFLLLITFIITFPLIEQGIPVKLPQGKADTLEPKAESLTVSIDEEGRVFIGEEIVSPEILEMRLSRHTAEHPDAHVLVRGDERAAYGSIVGVLKIIHRLGITRMALITREDG